MFGMNKAIAASYGSAATLEDAVARRLHIVILQIRQHLYCKTLHVAVVVVVFGVCLPTQFQCHRNQCMQTFQKTKE